MEGAVKYWGGRDKIYVQEPHICKGGWGVDMDYLVLDHGFESRRWEG